jgi:hypothetical protein
MQPEEGRVCGVAFIAPRMHGLQSDCQVNLGRDWILERSNPSSDLKRLGRAEWSGKIEALAKRPAFDSYGLEIARN